MPNGVRAQDFVLANETPGSCVDKLLLARAAERLEHEKGKAPGRQNPGEPEQKRSG
jgi:hypothetical protein